MLLALSIKKGIKYYFYFQKVYNLVCATAYVIKISIANVMINTCKRHSSRLKKRRLKILYG